MKIIAINGSPRKKGNTATVLDHFLEGARSAGADTELVHLYGLPCWPPWSRPTAWSWAALSISAT